MGFPLTLLPNYLEECPVMAVWGALSGISWSRPVSLHQSWSEGKGYLSEVWAQMQGWRLYLFQGGMCCAVEDPGLAEGSGAQG